MLIDIAFKFLNIIINRKGSSWQRFPHGRSVGEEIMNNLEIRIKKCKNINLR